MQLVNVGMYQETDCPNKDLMLFECVRYSRKQTVQIKI